MPVSAKSAVERIARVIAGLEHSDNAQGSEGSASPSVDVKWEDRVSDALAILRTLREPDEAMARAGDVRVWEAMITAALAGHGGDGDEGDRGNPLAPPINIGPGS